MASLTLTSKRQATLPAATCREMGLKPGDTVDLEPRMEGQQRIWILRPHHPPKRNWVGCLRTRSARVTDHSMAAVRESIAAGRARAAGESGR
jgi:bifunctional DNA-binding transcriptional regulator/antitoxin component of YhaV-PrlF toxin-antitoxin module